MREQSFIIRCPCKEIPHFEPHCSSHQPHQQFLQLVHLAPCNDHDLYPLSDIPLCLPMQNPLMGQIDHSDDCQNFELVCGNCRIIDCYRLRITRSIQLLVNTVPLPVNIYPSKKIHSGERKESSPVKYKVFEKRRSELLDRRWTRKKSFHLQIMSLNVK